MVLITAKILIADFKRLPNTTSVGLYKFQIFDKWVKYCHFFDVFRRKYTDQIRMSIICQSVRLLLLISAKSKSMYLRV
jgi:hypothetical protein